MSNFDDVGDFHEKFGLDNVTHHAAGPRIVDDELMDFRIKFMREEFEEFLVGYDENDPVAMFDALIDLVYVAMGTAHLMGFPWQEGWDAVQRANMSKVRAQSADESKRGSSFDVVKPEGWQPPDLFAVLIRHMVCPACKAHLTADTVTRVVQESSDNGPTMIYTFCACGSRI